MLIDIEGFQEFKAGPRTLLGYVGDLMCDVGSPETVQNARDLSERSDIDSEVGLHQENGGDDLDGVADEAQIDLPWSVVVLLRSRDRPCEVLLQ